VALYGGFAGDENPATFNLADRDFAVSETVLDGNGAGSVVSSPLVAVPAARIDGFTIRHGKALNGGGGIYCFNCSLTIANNTITSNSGEDGDGGGGIYCTGSSPLIAYNTITANPRSGVARNLHLFSR